MYCFFIDGKAKRTRKRTINPDMRKQICIKKKGNSQSTLDVFVRILSSSQARVHYLHNNLINLNTGVPVERKKEKNIK